MLRQPLLACAVAAALAACGGPELPPTNAARCVALCDGGAPRGGGGGGGGGAGAFDAAVGLDVAAGVDASVTAVGGTLRVLRDLPPGAALGSAGGWTIRTLPLLDGDAGAPELMAVTDNTGGFTLPGVPARQALAGEGATGYWLLATAPAAGRIATLFTVREMGAVALQTVSDDTVRAALAPSGLVQADDRALVAVLVRQSSLPDAQPVRGVRVEAEGQSTASVYDGLTGLELAETGTGRLGFALLPNVPVPASGDGYATVVADRASRPYSVRVRRGALSWLVVIAN